MGAGPPEVDTPRYGYCYPYPENSLSSSFLTVGSLMVCPASFLVLSSTKPELLCRPKFQTQDLCLYRAVTESAELDFEVRSMAVPYGWLSVFVMVGVNLRDSVR